MLLGLTGLTVLGLPTPRPQSSSFLGIPYRKQNMNPYYGAYRTPRAHVVGT